MEEKSIKKTQEKIKRGGRVGYFFTQVVIILLLIFIVFHCVMMVLTLIDEIYVSRFSWIYEHNSLYRLITSEEFSKIFRFGDKNLLDEMQPKYRALIGIFASLLTWLVLLLFTRMAGQFFKHLAEGGRPFNVRFAKKMRYYAFSFILLVLYNPLLGIISFALVIFFS